MGTGPRNATATTPDTTVANAGIAGRYDRTTTPANLVSAPGSTPVAAFNYAAAGTVYQQAGTLDLKGWDFGRWAWNGFSTEGFSAEDVNIDDTIQASSAETNLAALRAGYEGTALSGDVGRFSEIILAHPELKAGFEAMTRNEGENVVSGFQQMVTGEGAIDMDQFAEMMENPRYRQMMAQMMTSVGGNASMEDGINFTRYAQAAMRNPRDEEARRRFLEHAEAMGVETSGLEQAAMMDQLQDFFRDPQRFIVDMVNSMNLPPEYANMLTSFLGGTTAFLMDTGDYYWNGQNGQPGIRDIASGIGERLENDGEEIRARYAAAPAGPGLM